MGTIVCDVTDAVLGQSAAAFAGALGARLGLRVVLVLVVDGLTPETRDSVSGPQGHSGAERALNAAADELGMQAETRIAFGDRAEAVARVAAEEGADLIIVGSRAVGVGGRNLRCRVARDLEATTPVPVLVAPPATRKRSGHRLVHANTR
jgi:nucleotide-binding universal stress UspA family protein